MSNYNNKQVVFILLGPTGIGKTKLSLKLAKQMTNIEIISADSMQIYKYMNIGTDKPNRNILSTIKHHMVDIIEPDKNFDVSQYCEIATEALLDVFNRKKIPLMVGGTGLYISSMIFPLFSGPGKDLKFRRVFNKIANKRGVNYLYEKLSVIDPVCANQIHSNDLQRIIRALEVYKITGKTISTLRKSDAAKNKYFNIFMRNLIIFDDTIYKKINIRVDNMIELGLIEEVKTLRKMGYKADLNSMQGLGYKQIGRYLNGKHDKETAINRIKIDTRHYAKRQMTWFKNKIKDVQWINLDQYEEDEILSQIENKIKEIYKID
ncbi:MAG: tRNA (adenosine(37)-N6)-dimethylallyltransferase MiaA [Candidatus Atribacteria bacterium]|nr:tRNA (adenosine(37)-N6)-dimethylallyltransferase MiaA [Candidatus Atribacteria bacterium]